MLNLSDKFGRYINYLRISITDRCNLRCEYCMPEEGVKQIPHTEILSYDEIIKIIDFAVKQGINRIRITGGEPLVRKDVLSFFEKVIKIPDILDLGITTNGVLLEKHAEDIFKIGIKRVNISLDTLNADRFKKITRRDEILQVKKGIEKVLKLGFNPVKINVVVIKGINDDEIDDFVKLIFEYPIHLRFIGFMPIGVQKNWNKEKYVSANEIKSKLKELYLIDNNQIIGSGPAIYYKLPAAKGSIGFIDCMEKEFCNKCNRLRLTSDGKIRNCLFSDSELDLKHTLRNNFSEQKLENIFRKAIENKPHCHPLFENMSSMHRTMSKIGG